MSTIEITLVDLSIPNAYSSGIPAASELLSPDSDIELRCVSLRYRPWTLVSLTRNYDAVPATCELLPGDIDIETAWVPLRYYLWTQRFRACTADVSP